MQAILKRANDMSLLLWGISGFCTTMAVLAMIDQGYGFPHLSLCLSGKASLFGPGFALGHCAWCWASAASALTALGFKAYRRNCCH